MAKRVGFHANRLKADHAEREREFAAAWEREGSVLSLLIGPANERATPSPRDEQIAATVIQWLGSNVGQAFLRELGYEKKGPR